MLKSANSEDELAAIIAHEISHIQLEHSIKAIKKNTRTQNAGKFATMTYAYLKSLQGNKSEQDINLIKQSGVLITSISTELINTGYSKNSEYNADKMAIYLLEKTGYNPNSMITMLENLKKNKSKNYLLAFGKTHPRPNQRIKKANKVIKKMYKNTTQENEYNEDSRTYRFENIKLYF